MNEIIIKYWNNYLDNLDKIKTMKELVNQNNRPELEKKWTTWDLGNKIMWKKDLQEYFRGKLDFVVEPSIPIIWFGDIYKYFKERDHNLRIVSVGLNPSDNEFIDDNKRRSFYRFFDFTKDEEKEFLAFFKNQGLEIIERTHFFTNNNSDFNPDHK